MIARGVLPRYLVTSLVVLVMYSREPNTKLILLSDEQSQTILITVVSKQQADVDGRVIRVVVIGE